MSRSRTWELARLPAQDGLVVPFILPENAQSIFIINPLGAQTYVAFRASPDASPSDFHLNCLPHGWASGPIVAPSTVAGDIKGTALIAYPGAVPSEDAGMTVRIYASELAFAPLQALAAADETLAAILAALSGPIPVTGTVTATGTIAQTVAAGADVTEGNTTDAAIITDTTGTLSGKLRGLVKWAFERMPASLGQKTKAASLPVVIASDQDKLGATIAAGDDATEGNTTDAAVITDANGTLSGKLRGLVKWAFERMPAALGQTTMAGSLPVTVASNQSALPVTLPVGNDGSTGAPLALQGNVGSGVADAGNPVEVGGVAANLTTPTAVTAGQRVKAWFGLVGQAVVSIISSNQGNQDGWTNVGLPLDPAGTARMMTIADMVYNNASFDRLRNNHEVSLLASAARTVSQTLAVTNYNARMAYVVIDVTAYTAGGITPKLQAKDTASGKFFDLHAAFAKIVATGTYVYFFALNPPAAAGGVTAVGFPLPRVGQLVLTVDDATSITYSAAINYIN